MGGVMQLPAELKLLIDCPRIRNFYASAIVTPYHPMKSMQSLKFLQRESVDPSVAYKCEERGEERMGKKGVISGK